MDQFSENKTHSDYTKHDKNILCKWLSYQSLFERGLTLEDVNQRYEQLKKVRLFFRDTPTLSMHGFVEKLLRDNFTVEKSNELFSLLEGRKRELFLDFLDAVYQAKSVKNHDIRYWTHRGHNLKQAKKKLESFSRRGAESTWSKRRNSDEYDFFFRKSRSNGGIAAHQQLARQENRSKVEIEIHNMLESSHRLEKYYTPVVDAELKQVYGKNNFVHDLFIDDKLIVEYNGGFWHKDFTRFPQFSKSDYIFEIKKAHNCLHQVGRKNSPAYLIVWEKDFDSASEIVDFIEQILEAKNTSGLFYSSRQIDYELFEEHKEKYLKKQKEKSRFKEITLRFAQDSHCERIKVAAIAVKDGRIIATGINGTPSGYVNCSTYFRAYHASEQIRLPYDRWKETEEFAREHHAWSERNETHAEQSLICEAAKKGISLEGAEIYVSHRPCIHCSKMLTAVGVNHIYYVTEYDKADEYSRYMINQCGIVLEKI